MEWFNINYLKKNIPIPTEKEYKIQLIAKVESFTNRMKWKARSSLENGVQTKRKPLVLNSTIARHL